MADETVKKLLIKLGISTADWKVAINEIKSQLNAVNEKAKSDAAAMKKIQKEQIDLTRQQILDQKKMIAEAKVLQEVDRAKTVWQKQQAEAIKTAIIHKKLETEEAKKQATIQTAAIRMSQEQLRLEQQRLRIYQQSIALQQKQAKQQSSSGHGGGGGIFGGVGGVLAGAFGGGPIGMIAAGASIGNIVTDAAEHLLEKAVETMHRLGEAIVEATGPAAQLREQFEKLTKRAGEEPDEYLNKLRKATRGLADDVALYRIANNFMQQGLKLTNDDVVKLIGNTVDLARAQGKDAVQATSALERASKTGRMQQLAMVTGLSRQELQLKGVSSALDLTTRKTMEFNQVSAAMEARLKAVGTPATTLPELFKQLHNVQKNFIDDIAIAITKSQGYKDSVEGLSKVLFGLEPLLSNVVKWFSRLTDLLELIKPVVLLIVSLGEALGAVVKSFTQLTAAILTFGNALKGEQEKVNPFRKFIADLALGFLTLAEYVELASIRISHIGDIIDAVIHKDFAKAKHAYADMQKEITQSKQEYFQNALGIAIPFEFGIGEETKPAGTQGNTDPNAATRMKQIEQLRLQLHKEYNQIEFDMTMDRLKREETAVKQSYERGLINLENKVAQEKEIYKAEHRARLIEIEDNRAAEVDNILAKGKESKEPKDVLDLRVLVANERAKDQVIKEQESFDQKNDNADMQLLQDKQAAYRIHQESLAKIAKEGVQDRLKILEYEFKEGLVDVDKYISKKKELINEEEKVTIDGFELERKAAKDNQAELAKIDTDITEAHRVAATKRTDIDSRADEIRLQYLKTKYKLAAAPLETQVKLAKGDVTGRSVDLEDNAQSQLLNLAKQQLHDLLLETPKEGSDAWFKLKEDIADTTLKIQDLNQELRKLHSIPGQLGGIFGSISGAAGAFPNSTFGTNMSQLFGNMQSSSQSIASFGTANQAIKDKAAANVDAGLDSGPTNIISSLASSFKDLFDKTKPLSDSLDSLGQGIGAVLDAITGFVKGVTSGKTGGEGALSGGMAGMQLGAETGVPFGGLIGLGIGATMGGIFGAKNKQLQQDIHKIQTQMQSIVSDMQAGAISLSQAISDLRRERQQAIAMLAKDPKGGKGGGKGGKKGYSPTQAQAVIQQIDAQIQQLVNEQSMVLQNLTTSLMELSNPSQFQEYLQSLDQIIQKYQQFASAAQGNTQMVAEANMFLNQSLNQYVETLSNQLNQAQQTAIQDALTLINLEYQRQQLINQEAQQEYDILTQGVLVRQRTTAMTKGQEIGALRYQRDMQLQQMDEQIALQQHKVDAETQIFNLATTRIGLEQQLLLAQETAADYQVRQIQALSQVVGALTSGLTGGALMSQITQLMSSGALPTQSGIMMTLLQILGLSGNVPPGITQGQYGTQNWLGSIPSTDASAAQFMAAMDPNFPNLILNKQYKYAAAEAQQFADQGEVEGYDMVGFIDWLKQQPGAFKGGDVTGPVMVGEQGPELLMPSVKGTVLSNPIITALNAMVGATSGMRQSPVNDSQIGVHQTLYDLTTRRTDLEMRVITARNSQLLLEMDHLKLLQETLASLPAHGTTSGGFEDMLQHVYQVRGRYGSGNFRREVL